MNDTDTRRGDRSPRKRRPRLTGRDGFLTACILHVLVQGLAAVVWHWVFVGLALPVTQFLYVMPLAFSYRRRGEHLAVAGAIWNAAIVFLLGAAVTGSLFHHAYSNGLM